MMTSTRKPRAHGTPTLGHPSRAAAVRAMLADGATPAEIRARLGLTSKTAWDAISQARDMTDGRDQIKIRLSPVQARRLAEAADAHGLSRCRMARKILRLALSRGLVATIVGDEEGAINDSP